MKSEAEGIHLETSLITSQSIENAVNKLRDRANQVSVCPVKKKNHWGTIRGIVQFGRGKMLRGFLPVYPKSLWVDVKTFCNGLPFHIVFDEELRVKQAGVSIQRIVPGLQTMGIRLDQYFSTVHPEVTLTISNVRKFINSQFVFRTKREMMPESWRERPMLELRGQMIWMESFECMLYLCSPLLRNLHELEERQMHISDIAPHDVTRDLILLNQQRLAEMELSNQLERKKEELRILSKHLEEEKKKTEALLYAMLPKHVANQLKEGKRVEAVPFFRTPKVIASVRPVTLNMSRSPPPASPPVVSPAPVPQPDAVVAPPEWVTSLSQSMASLTEAIKSLQTPAVGTGNPPVSERASGSQESSACRGRALTRQTHGKRIRKASPRHSESGEVETDYESEGSLNFDKPGFQESVDSLIEAVNQSLGIEDELVSSSDHKVIHDQWVAELVSSGYKIELVCLPPPRFFPSRLPRCKSLRQSLFNSIESLRISGVISPVPKEERFQGFYSNLFVVPKKDGAVRPILDLKLLNRFVRVRHFRMESLRSVISSLEKGEFLASVDIQDAYLHIPIFPLHQKFLRFAVNNLHFQFTALPFGLASAPRVFTKVMSTVVSILHSRGIVVLPYLDDLLIKGPTFQSCRENVGITLDTLSRLGWLICHLWGTPDVDLMASKRNAKVPSFVSRYRDPQAIAVDALDKVVLRPAPSFLPKVVSSFHINEDIVLPSFCPAPTHRVEKALYTLDLGRRKGCVASKSTLAKWIRATIQEAYRSMGMTVPARIKAHSTRAVGASWAVRHQASAEQVCEFKECTILFSDVVTFTNICAQCEPIQIVAMLNSMYLRFDRLTTVHDVYKVETIGDAYMVVGGVPVPVSTHAERVANFALGMILMAREVQNPITGNAIQIRVGLHTGPVLAGVVGEKMPRYCLFGDTVNTASRMESHGVPSKIHLSPEAYRSLYS
ncbi:unnamed protein product [Ranitomeya imitator]|uniref:Guanylate cyclase n=1 Tax=Ranitomeya imitator TaxID=111125 RepID=A0ABN9MCB6_9NEOB|nr:unnamed protein product [Ranitomeya imitator]